MLFHLSDLRFIRGILALQKVVIAGTYVRMHCSADSGDDRYRYHVSEILR